MNYYALIFSTEAVEITTRAKCGFLIKNNINYYLSLSDPNKIFLKNSILPLIFSENNLIRSTATTIASAIVCSGRFVNWIELFNAATQGLLSNNPLLIEGSFTLYLKIIEDSPLELDSLELNHPLNTLVPIWIKYLSHSSDCFKRYALLCLEALVISSNNAIESNISDYLNVNLAVVDRL